MSIRKDWLLVVALLAASAPAGAGARPFSVRPPGAWVLPYELPAVEAPATEESTGTHYVFFDRQVRAGTQDQEDFFRTVWRVETTAGLQDASEIELDFDPTFERLVIHHARVVRAGRAVWSFSPAEVRVTDAEQDLEARLYNGGRTATILVKGLRVGDTVDYAFTLEGRNPVLAGHFEAVLGFEFSQPIDRVRRRVVWQRATPLRTSPRGAAPRPTLTQAAGETVYEWNSRHTRAVRAEDRTPSWFVGSARVELSDFAGWAEVVQRNRELFASLDESAPSLDALVRGWRLEQAPEDARIDRAVRFVQDDVRYLGLELGPHSHQPHPPAQTLERRFGDCKDKAALLVALLRRLGVKAWPALVSTTARQGLDERLPALFAFDHVIVALQAGRTLQFVDATASEQGGRVRGRRPPPYARALVVDAATRGLTEMPYAPPTAPTVEVAETYALPEWNAAARLDVVTTYREEEADDMRQDQARSTRAEMGRKYREFYARELGPGIRALGLPSVEDDRERNVVVVREAYELPSLWKKGAHEFHAWFIDQKLERPRTVERSAPLALTHPDHVRQTLTVRLPGPPDLAPLRETIDGKAFELDATWSVRGNEAQLQYTYRSLRGSLPPKDVAEFADRTDRASDLVVCRVAARPRAAAAAAPDSSRESPAGRVRPLAAAAVDPPGDAAAGWLGLLLLGGGAAGLVAWGARAALARRRESRRQGDFLEPKLSRTGEQPRAAILVPSLEAIPPDGVGGACACGGPWRESERAAIVYDSQPMAVITRRCARCAGERTLYFRGLDR